MRETTHEVKKIPQSVCNAVWHMPRRKARVPRLSGGGNMEDHPEGDVRMKKEKFAKTRRHIESLPSLIGYLRVRHDSPGDRLS